MTGYVALGTSRSRPRSVLDRQVLRELRDVGPTSAHVIGMRLGITAHVVAAVLHRHEYALCARRGSALISRRPTAKSREGQWRRPIWAYIGDPNIVEE